MKETDLIAPGGFGAGGDGERALAWAEQDPDNGGGSWLRAGNTDKNRVRLGICPISQRLPRGGGQLPV